MLLTCLVPILATKGSRVLEEKVTETEVSKTVFSHLKFTSNHSLTNVPFLDVMVSLNNGTIETDLYTKPTDKHQHLLNSSCHPQHTKKAIPFSLALRIRRICSTDTNFTLRLNELRTYLLARGYGNTFLDSQFKRATNISRTEALHTNRHDSIDRLSFVVTYNPSLPHISNILRKHFHILLSSKRYKEVFKHPPIVAYRRTSNLLSYKWLGDLGYKDDDGYFWIVGRTDGIIFVNG